MLSSGGTRNTHCSDAPCFSSPWGMADVCQENEKLVMKGGGLRRVAVAVGCCNSALVKSVLPALFSHLFLALQKCVTNFTEEGKKGRKEERAQVCWPRALQSCLSSGTLPALISCPWRVAAPA